MIIHNFDPVFIDFGVLQIRWYSMAYIIGIVLGWIYARNIVKKLQEPPTAASLPVEVDFS